MQSGLKEFRLSVLPALDSARTAQELCLFGKYELAEKLLRTDVELAETVHGESSGRVDVPLLHLGEFLLARGRPEEAKGCFIRSLMLYRASAAQPSNIAIAHRRQYIGQCHLALGQTDIAMKLFQYSLQLMTIAGGQRNVFALQMMLAIAHTLRIEAAREQNPSPGDTGVIACEAADNLEAIVAQSPITGVSWPQNRFI